VNPTAKAGLIIVASIFAVALVVALLNHFDLESYLHTMLAEVQNAGTVGVIVFAAMVAGAVVLLLPSVVFTLGAGFLFGVAYGSLLIVGAETIGSIIAFLVARYALGNSATAYLHKRAKLMHVSKALMSHGWQIIAVFRMIPFFPFKLSNYVFGLVPVSLRDYIVGTFIGLWPITVFNVYLGSLAADLVSLDSAVSPRTPTQWVIYGAGFAVAIAALLYLTKLAQRLLTEYKQSPD